MCSFRTFSNLEARSQQSCPAVLCVVFPRSLAAKLLGVVLLVTPHLLGAPQPTQVDDAVPAEMARAFAFGSLAISAVMWLILGAFTPVLLRRGATHQNRGNGASPV